jgi:hypothetical protein
MATQDGAQEVIVVFDPSGSKVDAEISMESFQKLLSHDGTLAAQAASLVKAAYAQVGAGLAVRALVFFQFRVDEEGRLDPAFNLPLEYMANNAGLGPDLGLGPVRMASRAQCPVPWHGINLWEPTMTGDAHPAQLVQKAVWRNRVGLTPVPVTRTRQVVAEARSGKRRPHEAVLELDQALGAGGEVHIAEAPQIESRVAAGMGEPPRSRGRARRQTVDRSRERSDGRAPGRDAVPLLPPSDHFRAEMQRQQQGYLEQIKACREEIQKLKSALRHERERNRRLQQLLRGDV